LAGLSLRFSIGRTPACVSPASFFSLSFKGNQAFVLIDLNHVNATLNSQGAVRIDGIIGADFLKSNKAIIDYSLRKLFL
jgi:hypothetical protein